MVTIPQMLFPNKLRSYSYLNIFTREKCIKVNFNYRAKPYFNILSLKQKGKTGPHVEVW
jgi:hypothetical protein